MKNLRNFALCVLALGFTAEVTAAEPVSFNRDVRKILAANCFACHGPDEEARKAGLRLDLRDAAVAVREGSTAAIVAGDSAASALIQRITTADPGDHMPPAETGKSLNAREIELLTAWIDGGADYEAHWSFQKPVKAALPAVSDPMWPRNGIDYFVMRRLDAEGLKPSPEAARETLIRRVYLDLTGLPPTPEAVDAFVNDSSAVAYERVVEELLRSPRFGERWARVWLDLARYADTQGYEKDGGRSIWKYRDWVIDALNADMPYDTFTIQQLAGDLLPGADLDTRIATAFNRNTMTNTEGGTDDEEFRAAAVVDRVNTTFAAWMGLTVGCAQCHTHKYDPITQAEYYQLYAFFNQTADNDLPEETPVLPCPAPAQQAALEHLDRRLAEIERKKAAIRAAEAEQFAALTQAMAAAEATAVRTSGWYVLGPIAGASPEAILAEPYPFEHDVDLEKDYGEGLKFGKRPELDSDPLISLFEPGQGAVLYQRLTSATAQPRTFKLSSNGPFRVMLSGKTIYESNEVRRVRTSQDEVTVQLAAGENALVVKLVNNARKRSAYIDPGPFAPPMEVTAAAAKPEASRTAEEQGALENYFVDTAAPFAEVRGLLAAIKTEREAILASVPTVPVLEELPPAQQRETHIQIRGNYLNPGDAVSAAVPEAFHPFPEGAPANRLGLAQWIASPENPLTARVAVNRYWEKFWGTGIVETSEDFGTQGNLPTHPQLLDWMAVEFVERGWSLKELCRLIVTSAAYRQSSAVTPALRASDPFNVLLARGPRFRLEAETIRDQALAVSGLVSAKMHGPSVMPFQPEGVWQVVYSGESWKTSEHEDRYRRGIYTYWRRTAPYPSMIAFDAPSREVCNIRRIRTNTPLQALVVLNDPVYLEAAQALARAVMTGNATDTDGAIAQIFRRVLARTPSELETRELRQLFESERAHFAERPEDALALATEPRGPLPEGLDAAAAAAWTVVCNAVLNLDETLTRT